VARGQVIHRNAQQAVDQFANRRAGWWKNLVHSRDLKADGGPDDKVAESPGSAGHLFATQRGGHGHRHDAVIFMFHVSCFISSRIGTTNQ
jgi:hypothetical protein